MHVTVIGAGHVGLVTAALGGIYLTWLLFHERRNRGQGAQR